MDRLEYQQRMPSYCTVRVEANKQGGQETGWNHHQKSAAPGDRLMFLFIAGDMRRPFLEEWQNMLKYDGKNVPKVNHLKCFIQLLQIRPSICRYKKFHSHIRLDLIFVFLHHDIARLSPGHKP